MMPDSPRMDRPLLTEEEQRVARALASPPDSPSQSRRTAPRPIMDRLFRSEMDQDDDRIALTSTQSAPPSSIESNVRLSSTQGPTTHPPASSSGHHGHHPDLAQFLQAEIVDDVSLSSHSARSNHHRHLQEDSEEDVLYRDEQAYLKTSSHDGDRFSPRRRSRGRSSLLKGESLPTPGGTTMAPTGDECCEEEGEPAVREVYINQPERNAEFGYCDNQVITSKFTVYNFLPKLLFYEFSKLANAYFLVISIMQTIKPISNTGGFPASLPALTIIVVIDMVFACMEDYKRHVADNTANELPCQRFNIETRSFEPSRWLSLQVGDIIKVTNREAVAADVVLLGGWEPEPANPAGICYVETKSLDGETNLKLRQGLECTYTRLQTDEQVARLRGVVTCETPNNVIHRFDGTITLDDGTREVISLNTVMLRGSTLRNTEYVYGLVVNTGPDTKIMMAMSDTPVKWSNLERRLNHQILYICALVCVLCTTGAVAGMIWNKCTLSRDAGQQAWYLHDPNALAVKVPVANLVVQMLYYFLLLNSFIPVSLYVSMTSCKFMQSYFMNMDLDMYHAETDTPFQVRTMALNEELGQIDYIFTDKTGTLTCNVMEFRKCTINGIAYGIGETEIGLAAKRRRQEDLNLDEDAESCSSGEVAMLEEHDGLHTHRAVKAPFVNYQDDSIFEALSRSDKNAQAINDFWEHLGVCHTVMPEKTADGEVRLSASSPDEQALVAAAACFGYKFCARCPGKAVVERFDCVEKSGAICTCAEQAKHPTIAEYQILEVLEFNSTRKRMSVIVETHDGRIKLLCKGADTVMYERLRPTKDEHVLFVRNQTLAHMEQFASEGLRTLVIGSSELNREQYEIWSERYRQASNDMKQIELRRNGEVNDIDRLMDEIEVGLEVLGATAIEDRLQDDVPDTIAKLREASIKIWMLTGDKEETAINIGFACRLLTADIERIVISGDSHPDLTSIQEELARHRDAAKVATDAGQKASKEMEEFASSASSTKPVSRADRDREDPDDESKLALVIDGETLELALEQCPMLLLEVAQRCCVVIACRVSPAQKAQLVCLVRENLPKVRTLAIGDGANDVCMIQRAHVGVGISGQEGMQAVNSSDYAIAQFRFLKKLLLVHGRWNYIRMGKLILYIFYKNVMMNLTQFWYMIFTGFSGQKFFLEWGLQGYNLLFTSVPVVLVAIFDQDLNKKMSMRFPRLYRVGQENKHFNTRILWAWITSCAWESVVICFGTVFGMNKLVPKGETVTMWVFGCAAFTIVVLVASLKLALHQQMWWPIHFLVYFLSFTLWIMTSITISFGHSISSSLWNGVFQETFGAPGFWLVATLLVVTALCRDVYWKGYMRGFHPSYKHLAQEVVKYKLEYMADRLLAYPPPEKMPDLEEGEPSARRAARDARKQSKKQLRTAASTTATLEKTPSVMTPKLTDQISLGRAPVGSIATRSHRTSTINRGTAFSYDAESIMVESFLATEYIRQVPDRRHLFERHGSRGSIAFRSLSSAENPPTSDSLDRGNPMARSFIGRRTQRHSSAGTALRAEQRRGRFFSMSNISTTPLLGNNTPRRNQTSFLHSTSTPIASNAEGLQPTPNATAEPSNQLVRRYTVRKISRQRSV